MTATECVPRKERPEPRLSMEAPLATFRHSRVGSVGPASLTAVHFLRCPT